MLRVRLMPAAFAVAAALGSVAPAAFAQATFAPMTTFGGGDGYLAPGDRSYLGVANNERGLAYNASTNNVYVLSRSTAPPSLAILNGDTGAEQQVVSVTGLTEGTFLASQIRVADDGAIYVANLATPTSAAQSFKVYRYANEAALINNASTLAYEGDVIAGQRYGDSFNVRGSGTGTQFIAGSGGNFANFAVFTTTNGTTFTPNTYGLAGNGDAANGVAFGPGNTVYVKQVGEDLRLLSFTPGATTRKRRSTPTAQASRHRRRFSDASAPSTGTSGITCSPGCRSPPPASTPRSCTTSRTSPRSLSSTSRTSPPPTTPTPTSPAPWRSATAGLTCLTRTTAYWLSR
jgi:hypothetical protein